MCVTREEWQQWVRAVAARDYHAGVAVHDKARAWLDGALRHRWLNRSDGARFCTQCVRSAVTIDQLDLSTEGRRCCYTDQTEGLVVVVFHMLADGDEPQTEMDDRVTGSLQRSVEFTVHRNLYGLLRCLSFAGLVWLHVAQCAELGQPGDHEGYLRSVEWVERVLRWVDQPGAQSEVVVSDAQWPGPVP